MMYTQSTRISTSIHTLTQTNLYILKQYTSLFTYKQVICVSLGIDM